MEKRTNGADCITFLANAVGKYNGLWSKLERKSADIEQWSRVMFETDTSTVARSAAPAAAIALVHGPYQSVSATVDEWSVLD